VIIGIGTDIIEIKRIEKLDLDKFAKKILTESEIKLLANGPQRVAKLAKRFAAKEAIAKAFGTGIGGDLSFQDIEISSDEKGKPLAKISNQQAGLSVHLSIADEKEYAVAFAVIEKL